MNIYERLLEVRKGINYLQKENAGFDYKYVSSSQTLASVRGLLNEHGIMIIPRVTGSKMRQYETKKGHAWMTELKIKYSLVNASDPNDCVELTFYAQGSDGAEKGIGKALTYAEKYMLLKLFNIPTDLDDPDAFQQKSETKAEAQTAERKPAATGKDSLAARFAKMLEAFLKFGIDTPAMEHIAGSTLQTWGDNELKKFGELYKKLSTQSVHDREASIAALVG